MNAIPRRGAPIKVPAHVQELLTCHSPNPLARLRLICFPFAGGGASVFSNWAEELPAEIRTQVELHAVQLPGREANMRVAPFEKLEPLLMALVPAIVRHAHMPLVFLGHSMGALVSFEVARELRRLNLPGPAHMIVSGHRAPQVPDRLPAIHRLPDAELAANLRKFGGTPEAVLQNPELMELVLPVLRADFAVCESYVHVNETPLACSISALGGSDDEKVSRDELSAWQAQTAKSFSMHLFPGDHFFIQSAQSLVLRVVARDLSQVLRRLPSDA